jgi:hypothetical protein
VLLSTPFQKFSQALLVEQAIRLLSLASRAAARDGICDIVYLETYFRPPRYCPAVVAGASPVFKYFAYHAR